jgi:hypothetical protein
VFVRARARHRACQWRWLGLGDAPVCASRGSVRGRGGYACGARERRGLPGGYGRGVGHGGETAQGGGALSLDGGGRRRGEATSRWRAAAGRRACWRWGQGGELTAVASGSGTASWGGLGSLAGRARGCGDAACLLVTGGRLGRAVREGGRVVAERPFFYSFSLLSRRRCGGELRRGGGVQESWGERGEAVWPLVAGWELGRAPWRPAARQVFDQSLWLLFEIFENWQHSKMFKPV